MAKSSFSIGFRSYVRDFLGAIFMLFRPSVPWCFPVRQPFFEPHPQQQEKQQEQQHQYRRKNHGKIIIFYRFQKLR